MRDAIQGGAGATLLERDLTDRVFGKSHGTHGIHGRISGMRDAIQGGVGAMLLERDLTYRIRSCVFEVYSHLGHGFLERVYENALSLELRAHGLPVRCQVPVDVRYKGSVVGQYFADMIVDDRVLLELKAQERLPKACEPQILNYLKAGGIRVGLLINFAAPRATVRRMVL